MRSVYFIILHLPNLTLSISTSKSTKYKEPVTSANQSHLVQILSELLDLSLSQTASLCMTKSFHMAKKTTDT